MELTRRETVVTLLVVGWLFSFGGLVYVDYQGLHHLPSLSQIAENAIVAVFLGALLAGAGYWRARHLIGRDR